MERRTFMRGLLAALAVATVTTTSQPAAAWPFRRKSWRDGFKERCVWSCYRRPRR